MRGEIMNYLKIVLLVVVLIFIVAFCTFTVRDRLKISELNKNSKVISTSKGDVEFISIGEGSPVLIFHGGAAGYDSWKLYSFLNDAGYRIICPSRPGYLRTPPESGETTVEQADLFAALLDTLKIKKVAIIGTSAGGSVALEFAVRHPEKTSSLVLQCASSMPVKYVENYLNKNKGFMKFYSTWIGSSLFSWLNEMFIMNSSMKNILGAMADQKYIPERNLEKIIQYYQNNSKEYELFIGFSKLTLPVSPRRKGLIIDLKRMASPLEGNIEKIKVPALVVHSQFDERVDFMHAKNIINKVQYSELMLANLGGHMIWIGEDGDKMQVKIIEFIKRSLIRN